jgi:S1-C subfamily serine protease
MKENRRRNVLRTIVPHAVTMLLTLIVAAFLFSGRDVRTASVGPRPESTAHESARPPFPTTEPALPKSPSWTGTGVDSDEVLPIAPEPIPSGRPGLAETGVNSDELNNIGVYEAVNRTVVNISTSATVRGLFQDAEVSGSGSGFVINNDGYILTNHHVVEGADVVQVGLFDGSVLDARVVGADPSNDVAVLRVSAPKEKLFPVVLGESTDLKVGQKVLALGNPFGLERTLTTGIVSSLDRSLEAQNGRMIRGVIQTDASINPGNSGGPLLNARGEVIGMTTAIYSKVGQSAGIGFAVPITMIKRVLKPLIEKGFVERATLGIARVFSLDEGLLVLGVEPGGPADRAGIRSLRVRYVREGPFVRARIDPPGHQRCPSAER